MDPKYKNLTTAEAAESLSRLAGQPYDLTASGALTETGRIERYICETGPFRMLYATQRVDDDVLNALQALADQCALTAQFKEMRSGAVMNRIQGFESEERQVLHTATRDVFGDTAAAPAESARARDELAKLKEFLTDLENGKITNAEGESFTTLVNVGIGGSDLGPRSIYEALKPFGISGRSVHFIANVDPDDAADVLSRVDLSRTLINIVSKSGTTLETLTNERLVIEQLRAAGIDPAKHCLAVTGEGSPMDDPDKYLRSFYMFDYIGGRYSSTSMVGSVMLGFYLGYDQLLEFLKGANEVDQAAETIPDIRSNLPLLLALIGVWNHNYLDRSTVAVLPYSQALHRFPAHLQQCDMESNGKSIHRDGSQVKIKTGPIVWGEPGTNGQHAFYQLLHQGTEIVPVEFIGFIKNQRNLDLIVEDTTSQQKLFANLLAQSIAMAVGRLHENPNKKFEGNRPSSLLLADKLTPHTMGALLAIYEAKIVYQGFLWDINSFDQEGVQLGKVLATRILKLIKGMGVEDNELENRFLKVAGNGSSSRIAR
ncbi:glucose-6-phosphate isomerase [Desulfosediminicola sp.]|uniref:glucose-6-phosphate isomerase n=1 Tax=Desulfosediminicola sp. TaxID=2886825 RepID=UPI003AF2C1A2